MQTQTIEVKVGANMVFHQGEPDHLAAERTRRLKQAGDSAKRRQRQAAKRRTKSLVREYRAAWKRIKAIGEAKVIADAITASGVATKNSQGGKQSGTSQAWGFNGIGASKKNGKTWTDQQVRCFRPKDRQATGGAA